MPDLSLFPRRQWLKCYHEAVEYASAEDLSYAPPSGRWDLRVAVSEYLNSTKGISAPPERIVVTSGSSQSFAILASIFGRARVVMEDPQAPFVRRVFDGIGCELSYVPVDDEGIIPDLIPVAPFDLLYLTPNHQFPVGGTLSAERRVSVLHRARASGAWIVEDDFDSEFRYEGHPVSPLAAMAPERVAYVGTFSKNVSPALRLGYLVVPPGLQARVKTLKRRWDLWNEGLQQKAMALFIAEGHLGRHLMRCHRAYGKKNAFLKALVATRLAPAWIAIGATTGMHLVLRRTHSDAGEGALDAAACASALKERGLEVETVGEYCQLNRNFRDSLIVAFGNRTEAELSTLVDALADLV
jgi:GntR family transcriptional regulator/MocR family aminotransferase